MTDYEQEQFLASLAYELPEQRLHMLSQQGWLQTHSLVQNDETFFSLHAHHPHMKSFNVHRGTASSKDFETDSQLALDRLHQTERYQQSKEKSLASRLKLGASHSIVEVGHSLGGTLADFIAQELNHSSVAFNMGTTPLHDYSKVDRTKHIHIRKSGDPISFFDNSTQTIHKDFKASSHWLDHAFTVAHPLLGGVFSTFRRWYSSHRI